MSARKHWHAVEAPAALAELEASEQGLTEAEAARRLERDGPNTLTQAMGTSWLSKLAEQFVQPLIVVLIAAAGLSIFLGDWVDASVIGGVVVVNAVIGFFQEYRAEHAINALSQLVVTEATVVRQGKTERVPSERLVAGDLVLLQSGDTVPADLKLLAVKGLKIEEAALTGESLPAEKRLGVLPAETVLGDRANLAFAGSAVVYGQGRGVVVAVGDHTEAGRIGKLMAGTDRLVTPLTRRIAGLSKLLLWIILGVSALLFVYAALRGRPLASTFNAVVALAVGAIPEGLPAAVTIVLAVGVSKMARRNALVRQLPAVETLGSTTVICSDKTGTLTENQMTVTAVRVGGVELELTGVGFSAGGEVRTGGARLELAEAPALVEVLRAGVLCNDTRLLTAPGGAVKVEGDPTEAALTVAARKAGLDDAALQAWRRLDVVPFESQHMYMGTLHAAPGGGPTVLYVKGSSDVLLGRCVDRARLDGSSEPLDVDGARAEVDALAARGLRVLVVARRALPLGSTSAGHAEIEGLTLLGLVGMIDPPRPAAKRAVAACQAAGIKVKMITGDHTITAEAIARELGLHGAVDAAGRLEVLSGKQLQGLDDAALAEAADRVAVFARVAPEQKLQLVRALQRKGHVVAMTGDGVNDAPALKQANIGVAMGKGGTDVARSAGAMILTDDDFATIAAAVEEGRAVYDNLVKFIAFTLPTNGGEGAVLLAAIALGSELPVLPVQALWVNMVTTVMLGTALIAEPKEPGLMARPPRPVSAGVLDRGLGLRTVLVSLALGAGAFGLFELAQAQGLSDAQARTIAVNTIVVTEVGYLFACRSLRLSVFELGVFKNPWVFVGAAAMLATQLAFTYVPFMNRLFHSEPIEWWWWGVLSSIGVVVFAAAEVKKLFGLPARRRARAVTSSG